MARFFIHRPVFAWVLAIVVMLAGGYAVLQLPVSQYPDIAPVTIRVSASYSGATAEAVQSSVTQVIEDGLTGLDGLLYTTASSSQGRASLSLTFDDSVDPIDAENKVQSKVDQVLNRLPDRCSRRGSTSRGRPAPSCWWGRWCRRTGGTARWSWGISCPRPLRARCCARTGWAGSTASGRAMRCGSGWSR